MPCGACGQHWTRWDCCTRKSRVPRPCLRAIPTRCCSPADKVLGLLHKEKQSPETLSAGEQQRVGIARAIVTRPKLLIADEPTGNLDPDLSLEVMRIFRRFNEVGVTLLIASHDISLIDRLGCRRIALEDGQLVEEEADAWL